MSDILDNVFSEIDRVRSAVQQKSIEQAKRFKEMLRTKEAKEREELEKAKQEYGNLLVDIRYGKFIDFISKLEQRFMNELKDAVKSGKSYSVIAGISSSLELLEIIKNHDKRIKDFLERLEKK